MSRRYWLLIRALERWLSEEPVYRRKREEAVRINREAQQHGHGPQIVAALRELVDQTKISIDQDAKTEKSGGAWERRRFWLDVVAVIGVFLAAVFAAGQLYFMRGQQVVMQGQLNEMQLEQRPWVQVNAAAGTSYDEGNGKIYAPHDVELEITNTGKTPAFFVWIDFSTVEAHVKDAAVEQRKRCSPWRGEWGRHQPERGLTLFPGQSTTITVGADLSDVKIAEAKKAWSDSVASGQIQPPPGKTSKDLVFSEEFFLSRLYGCINYKSVSGGEWHQTGFIYDIGRASGILPKGWKRKKAEWTVYSNPIDKGAYFAN